MKRLVLVLVLVAAPARADAPSAATTTKTTSKTPTTIQIDASAVPWKPAPPSMPKGTMLAVLEGDPKSDGIFTMRMKIPPGFALPAHTHPRDERITVLEGSVFVGLGDVVDKTKGRKFEKGAFYVTPTPLPHFIWSDEGATLQITGSGPWEVHPVAAPSSQPAQGTAASPPAPR